MAERLAAHPPPAAAAFVPSLKEIFREEGVPAELVWIAEVESSFDITAVSSSGAVGLFQFMPATAMRFGLLTAQGDDRLNPEKSARAAARYLRQLYARFQDWDLAVAAYHAGESRIERLLKAQGAATFLEIADYVPPATRQYVPKVMAILAVREQVDLLSLPAPRRGPDS